MTARENLEEYEKNIGEIIRLEQKLNELRKRQKTLRRQMEKP